MGKTKYWNLDTLKAKTHMWTSELTGAYLLPFLIPKQNEHYLDVGSGFSPLGHALYKHILPLGKIIGIDHDHEIVAEANKFAKEMNRNKNLSFKYGDVYSLDFPDDRFDAVICQQLLVNLENPKKAISEMIRVSKKESGRILVIENSNLGSFIHHPALSTEDNIILTNIFQKILMLGKEKHEQGNTSIGSKIYQLMIEAGLQNVQSQYLIPIIPEINFLNLNRDLKSSAVYFKQHEEKSKIFKLWAHELLPKQLSEKEWEFFYQKVFDKKYIENAFQNNLPLIQLVHPYSVTVGWLKKQPKTQFLNIETFN